MINLLSTNLNQQQLKKMMKSVRFIFIKESILILFKIMIRDTIINITITITTIITIMGWIIQLILIWLMPHY